ncbi:polyprenyl synthetase family protein [Duncaniella freteri]|uniref:polyprenyl synthetase family protein n=6 Tax=Duncaniella TaxID=2518495 RepID=UPI00136EA92A|nr:polyprenyl synthetase family protein [Duncaniella freteri]NBJ07551.1 polyprenyl synthetase family protein [Alistipes sp. Z76]NCE69636.1 polyprenyl synthetase family protein [Muribaculaceae bacterium M3]
MKEYNEYLQIVTDAISNLRLPGQPSGLYDPIRYTLNCGGKRLRPVLALAACEAFGKEAMTAIHQAIAIEMFHNFTLLHDDVMDKAEVRRGRPTVHVKWNEETAILSGDAMLTTANMLLAVKCGERLPQALELFNGTAMNIYEGQQYDMDFESRTDVTVEEYMEMIRLKTSVLLGCACGMGALMADAPFETQVRFFDFGVNLGLAFQLQDDYLDTYGDPETFGKSIGGDILNDKKTWLLIMAMNEDKSGRIKSMLGTTDDPESKIKAVRSIYDELDLPQRIHELISAYIDTAIKCLDHLELAPEARSFFMDLALKSATRNK